MLDLISPRARTKNIWGDDSRVIIHRIMQIMLDNERARLRTRSYEGLYFEVSPDIYARITDKVMVPVHVIFEDGSTQMPIASKRREGHYWVRPRSGWTVMFWDRVRWHDHAGTYIDSDMQEIDETRLERK